MKILIENDLPPPAVMRDNEDMRKLAMAFDGLQTGKSLLIPLSELKNYKTIQGAVTAIKNAIKKRKRNPDAKVIVRDYEEGIRIWKKE